MDIGRTVPELVQDLGALGVSSVGVASSEKQYGPESEMPFVSPAEAAKLTSTAKKGQLVMLVCRNVPAKLADHDVPLVLERLDYAVKDGTVVAVRLWTSSSEEGHPNMPEQLRRAYASLGALGPAVAQGTLNRPKVIHWKTAHLRVVVMFGGFFHGDGHLDVTILPWAFPWGPDP